MRKVLVVEDRDSVRRALKSKLGKYKVMEASCLDEAVKALSGDPEIIITDLSIPKQADSKTDRYENGLELLNRVREHCPSAGVFVMTIFSEFDSEMIGAFNKASQLIIKTQDDWLTPLVKKVDDYCVKLDSSEEIERSRQDVIYEALKKEIVGDSHAITSVLKLADKAAGSDATVLITGETGTGKELIARRIHALSSRKNGPMVTYNCANIPENLAESLLFGHKKGSFTDAKEKRAGKFAMAEKGSLFLDEFGEMSPAVQAKLLRVLETHEYEPLGGDDPICSDVRVICAYKDLKQKVTEGKFREDLYYRVNILSIHLPPIRERENDVILLADHFLGVFNAQYFGACSFSVGCGEAIKNYPWPGNVRELKSAIERAVCNASGEPVELTASDLGINVPVGSGDLPEGMESVERKICNSLMDNDFNLDKAHSYLNYLILKNALALENGNVTQAAKRIGIARETAQRWKKLFIL